METRMVSWISITYLLLLSQFVEPFFFQRLLRRRIFPGTNTRSARGQVEDQPSFRIITRPRGTNVLGPINEGGPEQNFQVPEALCLACGSFPWTPVAGRDQTIVGSVQAVSPTTHQVSDNQQSSKNNVQHQVKNPPSQNLPFLDNPDAYPVHQHLEVTKEPGNTVVINALGPDVNEGSRKPFAFAFGSSQNSAATTSNINTQGKEQEPAPFSGQIVIPYEKPKSPSQTPERPIDFPRVPSASTLNSGYAPAPQQYKPGSQGPNPRPSGSYKGPSSSFSQKPSGNVPMRQPEGKPFPSSNHPSDIPPITVGTILAAQQHQKNNYQIQPANLVYQEHTQFHQPKFIMSLPQRPQYGQGQSQQNYKVPIFSPPPGPSGTVTINQVPLHAVPNYKPHPPPKYLPQFIPQSSFNFPVPSSQAQLPRQYIRPQHLPLFSVPRQPKPGYSPHKFETPQENQYRALSQEMKPVGNTQYSTVKLPVQQQQVQSQQPVPAPSSGFRYVSLPQRPLPPARPYAPPEPSSSTPKRIPFPEKEVSRPKSPPPTYIPPHLPGKLYTSFPEETRKEEEKSGGNLNDLGEGTKTRSEVLFPQSEGTFEPELSEKKPVIPSNDDHIQKDIGFPDFSFKEPSPAQHEPITIPNLLQIKQRYRFVDHPESYGILGSTYRHQQFAVPVSQKEFLQGEETAQSSIHTPMGEETPLFEPEKDSFSRDTFPSPSPQPSSSPRPIIGEQYVVKAQEGEEVEKGKKIESERYGRYEVVPATQYDITHLFLKNGRPSTDQPSEPQQLVKTYPLPVPVPISETEVARSKSPLFIVGSEDGKKDEDSSSQYQPYSSNNGNQFDSNQNLPSYVQSPIQYDPLPQSVVSALHHAQSTSLLTHQHLVPAGDITNNENTIYVNSVPVRDNSFEYPSLHQPRLLRPIAFDLKSGKEIELQSSGNTQIPLEAEVETSQRKTIPTYTLQEESVLRPVFADGGEDFGDQTAVNCENSQQWVVPPPRQGGESEGNRFPPPRAPTQVQGQFYVQSEFPTYDDQRNDKDTGRKPLLFYYSSPLPSPSSYWVNQPSPSIQSSSTNTEYGDRILEETETTTEPEVVEDEETMSKTYPAKPVKWSKILRPKTKNEELKTPVQTRNQNLIPEENKHLAGDNEKLGSESKEVVPSHTVKARPSGTEDSYPIIIETGEGAQFEIAGPTTVADCVTESTTTDIPTTQGDEEEATTTTTTATTTSTRPSPSPYTPTFSPRIHPKTPERRNKLRTRFPLGRPTISTFRPTTEGQTGTSVSTAAPVYRAPQSISSIFQQTLNSFTTLSPSVTVEDISRSQEMKGGAQGKSSVPTTQASITTTYDQPLSLATVEDDEADDFQQQNRLAEFPTARKVPSSPSKFKVVRQGSREKTSTTGIVFSPQIIPTSSPTIEAPGPTSTKIIKTVRVRQRMRPGAVPGYTSRSSQLRSKVSGVSSRVRVMSRTSAAEYMKKHSEVALPEGETLEPSEEKEVKDALIEIKKI